MSIVVLNDATLELSNRDNVLLNEVSQLIFEVSVNGRVVGKVNLVSQESSPGKWEADEVLVIYEVAVNPKVSVVMETSRRARQTIAFMQLNGVDLGNVIADQYEIPLMSEENYPSLVLKTKITAVANVRELLASNGQRVGLSQRDGSIKKLFMNAQAAQREFERYGSLKSLNQAISQYRVIANILPLDDPNTSVVANELGVSLCNRFEEVGRIDDINEAIKQLQLANVLVPDGDSDKPGRLQNLGNAFNRRFERLGNLDDLDNAIQQQKAAVHMTPDSHPRKPARLSNLGVSLQTSFEQLGNLGDLEDAIVQKQKAVDLTPDTDPNKAKWLNNLGSALYARFRVLGNIADVDGSIAQMQLAVSLTPNDHPDQPSYLSNLGSFFHGRFLRLENMADLDNAIKLKQQAVDATPDSHPDKPGFLNNLGNSLDTRFGRVKRRVDIDNAILHLQKAVNLTPAEHADKPNCLTNLGRSLKAKFNHFGNLDDIDSSIICLQMAVDLTLDSHSSKSGYLGCLGVALRDRFIRLGNLADLDNVISIEEQALKLTPKNHPQRAGCLVNLAVSFLDKFNRFYNDCDAEAAPSYYSAAARLSDGPPTSRFVAVNSWIKLGSMIRHDSLMAAYGCALDLMPLVAWLGLPIADRHQHLIKIGGITREAAAAAISAEQYDVALEWLEQGRSIVWTQILHLRTPVDQLRKVNPELADRLSQVSRMLDRGPQETGFSGREDLSVEAEGRQYRALTAEWEATIKQVRALPDFKNFLRPLSSARLKRTAQSGPVVVFNITGTRCDGLALLPGREDVIHIPLPDITSERVTELRDQLKDQLYSSGIRLRHKRAAKRVTDSADKETCKRVLAELWMNLVKPVLDSLAFSPNPDVLPRIWWCTTGPLAFLPIHAAGIYGSDSGDSQLSSYAISSYIPTVSMLLDPVNPTANSPFKLLSVIQSSAPGANSIPSTKKELEYIRQHLTTRDHVVLEDAQGTKKRVMNGMKDCNWLHLACHGTQKADEPTKSGLLLEDGRLRLEEIIKLDLPHAEFAFLSACQTTTGDENLSEEAVHIAGGMLLAGYRSVVATMWSIKDELAPMVTDEFYRHIMSEGERPDPKKAAEALHMSVQKLRQQPGVQLTDWIPFVHLGI